MTEPKTTTKQEENYRRMLTTSIERRAAEYDVYRDGEESDAELADRAIAVIDDMMIELTATVSPAFKSIEFPKPPLSDFKISGALQFLLIAAEASFS